MTKPDTHILMGKIGGAHGIKGEVRLTPYTETPEAIAQYGPLSTDRPGFSLTIAAVRPGKTGLIARIEGIGERTAAEALCGLRLYAPRERLPEPDDTEDFYHCDLIGLDARLDSGVSIGQVSALPNFGAGDLLEVRDPRSGDRFLYPFTKDVVPSIRIDEGYLVIVPPRETEARPPDPTLAPDDGEPA